jgi:CDP-diacylglycerol--glycerol-3-phosphate 3-phosphatidyltransferase
MISEWLRPFARKYLQLIGEAVSRTGISPNALTVIGVLLNGVVAAIIAAGELRLGGVLLLFASAFDMLDGAVARARGMVSKLGGFLDSTFDRYSEVVVYVGVLVYLLDTDDAKLGPVLVLLSATGALMISYARARAEAAGYFATVGFAARTERVILLALALMIARPLWALWVLAIVTHLTALTRIIYVWRTALKESAGTGPGTGDATASPSTPSTPATPAAPRR